MQIWRLPCNCQVISLGDSPLILSNPHHLHVGLNHCAFWFEIVVPGYDLEQSSGIKVPSGLCDITELHLVERVGGASILETALWGKVWLIGHLCL